MSLPIESHQKDALWKVWEWRGEWITAIAKVFLVLPIPGCLWPRWQLPFSWVVQAETGAQSLPALSASSPVCELSLPSAVCWINCSLWLIQNGRVRAAGLEQTEWLPPDFKYLNIKTVTLKKSDKGGGGESLSETLAYTDFIFSIFPLQSQRPETLFFISP